MTPMLFRVIREGLGLEQAWLAERLSINVRTVARWEAGVSDVPEFAADELVLLEAEAAKQVEFHLRSIAGRAGVYPTVWIELDDEWPVRWQRAIAFRVRQQLPELVVEVADDVPE